MQVFDAFGLFSAHGNQYQSDIQIRVYLYASSNPVEIEARTEASTIYDLETNNSQAFRAVLNERGDLYDIPREKTDEFFDDIMSEINKRCNQLKLEKPSDDREPDRKRYPIAKYHVCGSGTLFEPPPAPDSYEFKVKPPATFEKEEGVEYQTPVLN